MKINFSEPRPLKTGTVVIGVAEGNRLNAAAADLDKKSEGIIKRAINGSHFEGKRKQDLKILAPPNVQANQIVLIGLGCAKDLSEIDFQNIGGEVASQVNAAKEKDGTVLVDRPTGCKVRVPDIATNIAYGATLSLSLIHICRCRRAI